MSLEKELLKAGLIDKKKARRLKHEKRVDQKKGKENQAAIQVQANQEKQKAAERQRVKEEQETQDQKAKQDRLKNLALGNQIKEPGKYKYHFATRLKHVLYMEISDHMSNSLAKGQHAIVEIPETQPEEFVIVPRQVAEKIKAVDPELIRCFH